MISIDTGVLNQLAHTARMTNYAIDGAVSALNEVTSHDDWHCGERIYINENISKSKTKIKQLQENGESFYSAIQAVSEQFAELEKNIPGRFDGLESIFGNLLEIPLLRTFSGQRSAAVISSLSGRTSSIVGGISSMLGNLAEQIHVVDFCSLHFTGK